MDYEPNKGEPIYQPVITQGGIDADIFNNWTIVHTRSILEKFDELEPVKHYADYFAMQDAKYKEVGKHGLYEIVMNASNPQTVAKHDKLVDEFNQKLPQIKRDRDAQAVQDFIDRLLLLEKTSPQPEE